MKFCSKCGITEKDKRIIKGKGGYVCSTCYQRERTNSKIEKLPEYGKIEYDEEGNPICHICGKAYKKLMSHVRQIHKMESREYKERFGLDVGKGIMCEESVEIARKRNLENYDVVVVQNLIKNGTYTRFAKGHVGRTKNMISEQTRQALIKRIKGIGRGR